MQTKTECVAIKVTPNEKKLIKQKADEANTTVSRLLYKIVITALNEGVCNEKQ